MLGILECKLLWCRHWCDWLSVLCKTLLDMSELYKCLIIVWDILCKLLMSTQSFFCIPTSSLLCWKSFTPNLNSTHTGLFVCSFSLDGSLLFARVWCRFVEVLPAQQRSDLGWDFTLVHHCTPLLILGERRGDNYWRKRSLIKQTIIFQPLYVQGNYIFLHAQTLIK